MPNIGAAVAATEAEWAMVAADFTAEEGSAEEGSAAALDVRAVWVVEDSEAVYAVEGSVAATAADWAAAV